MPKFVVAPSRAYWPTSERSTCYLKQDNWDDFTFKTLFELAVVTADGEFHKIGHVKIMRQGMESGQTELPEVFEALDESFCSLGQDQNYYEQLEALPNELGHEILTALRDSVVDDHIWQRFQDEPALSKSLLRSVSSSIVETTFRNIVQGRVPSTPFEFVFDIRLPDSPVENLRIDFTVVPNASPPTNVHVLIGRNGVGKSRMLAGIANAVTKTNEPRAFGMEGAVEFMGESLESGRFANLVAVAFSVFDRFDPLSVNRIKGDIRYEYVGLKRSPADEPTRREGPPLKTPEELFEEFTEAYKACIDGPRRRRWLQAMRILNADPGFAELQLDQLMGEESQTLDPQLFSRLSSGHKIVLLIAARLVELVDERTLVLIDEPESHLHPPLLGSLIRALSNLLTQRNGVAIVATHSPVVLQEVPRSCVWVLRRTGEIVTAERPSTETFGENVGILTHEVFQLEVTESGFHKLLVDAARTSTYEEIVEQFEGRIGAEGRAIARALTSRNRGYGFVRVLQAPAVDAAALFQSCATATRDLALRARLVGYTQRVTAATADYQAASAIPEFHVLPRIVNATAADAELSDLYSRTMVPKGSRGRAVYDQLKHSAPGGICPLCGQRPVTSLDHYLPKELYPDFAVFPPNLIPACSDCNKAKGFYYPSRAPEQLFHPYFDHLPGGRWLHAEVVYQGNFPLVAFSADPPAGWLQDLRVRVIAHFNRLDLGGLYAIYGTREIPMIRQRLEQLLEDGGPMAVLEHLHEEAQSRLVAEPNSWQSATYTALTEEPRFWNGDFGE